MRGHSSAFDRCEPKRQRLSLHKQVVLINAAPRRLGLRLCIPALKPSPAT